MLDHIDDVNASLSRAGMVTLQPNDPPTPPDSPTGGAGAVHVGQAAGLVGEKEQEFGDAEAMNRI